MFLNIQIYFIILKTYDQQFTLTTKKSLHIIFKADWTNTSRTCSYVQVYHFQLQIECYYRQHCAQRKTAGI